MFKAAFIAPSDGLNQSTHLLHIITEPSGKRAYGLNRRFGSEPLLKLRCPTCRTNSEFIINMLQPVDDKINIYGELNLPASDLSTDSLVLASPFSIPFCLALGYLILVFCRGSVKFWNIKVTKSEWHPRTAITTLISRSGRIGHSGVAGLIATVGR